ncbi:MAG: hypothetical protein KI792_11810 [Alphaproteobacteria bacterium]|nr:hypothetical protein [Alphaproteobacteria bacterium SS10]
MQHDGEARLSLLGALRLLRFKSDGIGLFSGTPEAARRSFRQTLPLLLMGMIALAMLRPVDIAPVTASEAELVLAFTATEAARGTHLGHWIGTWIAAELMKWFGFLVAVHALMRVMDHGTHFPRFVQVFNWMMVVRLMVLLVPQFLVLAGVFALEEGRGGVVIVYFLALAYQWFGYRTALEIPGSLAIALIIVETVMSVYIGSYAYSILLTYR